jgi:hypothetical protein
VVGLFALFVEVGFQVRAGEEEGRLDAIVDLRGPLQLPFGFPRSGRRDGKRHSRR